MVITSLQKDHFPKLKNLPKAKISNHISIPAIVRRQISNLEHSKCDSKSHNSDLEHSTAPWKYKNFTYCPTLEQVKVDTCTFKIK